jgi:hypothetical protein
MTACVRPCHELDQIKELLVSLGLLAFGFGDDGYVFQQISSVLGNPLR